MKNESIRLSIKFFEEIKKFSRDAQGRIKASEKYKNIVMTNIEEIIAGGMNSKELEALIDRYKTTCETPSEAYSIDDILSFFKVKADKKAVEKNPNNLLEVGAFYYHPALQIAPPPPVITILDDGTFKSSYDTEEFFLEIKECFTLEDLVDYFYKIMGYNDGFKDRDIGAFKHILKSYELDAVLYTIDESRFLAEDLSKPIPKNPFDMRDYMEEGIAVLEERKNICYMEGLNRVIPRNIK